MTRTRTALPFRFSAWLGSAIILLGGGVGAVGIPAQASVPAASSESSQPVYPSASPSDEEEDDESILIPTVTSQEGKFYLAVTDAAIDNVDSEKIMNEVRAAVDDQHAKILLGVDQKPNNLKGAGQLVRGMLLFGDTDALSDDWLEDRKTQGYVGAGWIVIGVMLPEKPGGEVEVSVDPGRNVSEVDPGSKQEIVDAGKEQFAAGNYTEGISAVALSSTQELDAPLDQKISLSIALGFLAVIALAIVFVALRSKRRKAQQVAIEQLGKDSERWENSIQRHLKKLRDSKMERIETTQNLSSSRAIGEVQSQREQALHEGPGTSEVHTDENSTEQLSPTQARALEQKAEELRLLSRAVEVSNSLTGGPRAALPIWNQIISKHQEGIELLVAFLDGSGTSQLEVSRAARTIIVTHTDELEQLRALTKEKSATQSALPLLQDFWVLRDELENVLASCLNEAASGPARLEPKLAAKIRGLLTNSEVQDDDPISVLRRFVPESRGN